MSDFYERVYEIVLQIPPGRVTTYGAIAKALGAVRSSRLVGIAMNCSHLTHPELPAHRVVNRSGLLTGKSHFTHLPMHILLEADGIDVIDDQVQDFENLFWDPSEHI